MKVCRRSWSALPAAGVLALIAALLLIPLANAASSDESDPQERLSEAQQRLADIGEEITDAEAEAEDAEEALDDADAKLREIEEVVNEVTLDVERQQAAVRDAERRLEVVEAEAEELTERFEDRVARLFKQGPELTFESLLSSGEVDEAVARTMLLERVTDGDQVDLERLDAASVAVDAERARLAEEEAELEDRLQEQQEVLAEAEELRESRALAAADARDQVEQLEAEEDDLADEEAELERLVEEQQREEERRQEEQQAQQEQEQQQEQQEQQQQESSSPSSDAGGTSGGGNASGSGYAWPMCAPVTSEYGPRWGRMHRGIDQGASPGTPIGAAKAGRVIFAGWQGGYGNLTLIQHDDGVVTAYAHQTGFAVSQGAQVSQGQTIGYVGSTGNSTGPHLHFETRVNGSAVNPRQFLSGSPC